MLVQEVLVAGLGPLGLSRTAALTSAEWLDLRSQVNRAQTKGLPSPIRCAACHQELYVQAAASKKVNPHFKHFAGQAIECPWQAGPNMNPEAIRAALFRGHQESDQHRQLCEIVLELIKQDPRYVPGSGAIDQYQAPTCGGRGRWPDVSFSLTGLGRFAIEVQLAPISAVDVAARSYYYEKESARLIWLLPTASNELINRWSARDMAHVGRGTHFHMDSSSIEASRLRGTLMLWATARAGEGLTNALVSLDDLLWTNDGHPFVFDRTSEDIFQAAERRRSLLGPHLLLTKKDWPLPRYPGEDITPDPDTDRLLRAVFSIWAEAKGYWKNYLSESINLPGMINPYLSSFDGRARAKIVEMALTKTKARAKMRPTIENKLREASASPQVGVEDIGAGFVIGLFPEIFRDDLREPALISGLLPDWASPL